MYDLAFQVPTHLRRGAPRQADASGDQAWYACYTKGRHEKQVALRLTQTGLDCFCPVYPKERQWHDRVKVVEWPLFPSYVFVRCGVSGLSRVVGTPGVVAIVSSNGSAVPIAADEIENVRRFAAALAVSGQSVESAEPAPFVSKGTRVRILSGPFIGVEGLVVERRGRYRVLVSLQAIAQSWEIEVPAASMERVHETTTSREGRVPCHAGASNGEES